jgi:hypothetical protein
VNRQSIIKVWIAERLERGVSPSQGRRNSASPSLRCGCLQPAPFLACELK